MPKYGLKISHFKRPLKRAKKSSMKHIKKYYKNDELIENAMRKHFAKMFLYCKIGDLKIAGSDCLRKKLFAFSLARYFLVILKIMH